MRLLLLVLVLVLLGSGAQSQIEYELLTPLPEPVSNNAVASVQIDGKWYIYSFSGIDTTKIYTGIHAKVFRYDVDMGTWSQLNNLPGNQPRIAAGASTIQGKIYVLGGYEVFQNGSEISVNSLHVFDPVTNTFEADAIPIPTAIDDQVQVVYKDSLLYSITGWSNFGNVDEVWIYDVFNKTWTEGTKTPIAASFQAFGASGTIIGDTIYFIGGAMDLGGFPASNRLRKGYINPLDASDLTWSAAQEENGISYRPGASSIGEKPFWLGGSLRTYNYNGIAYSDNTGVNATNRIVFYDKNDGQLYEHEYDFPAIMDLRGLVKIGDNQFVSVGGMMEDQTVTDRVIMYTISDLVESKEENLQSFTIKPTINRGCFEIQGHDLRNCVVELVNSLGQVVYQDEMESDRLKIDLELHSGVYFVKMMKHEKLVAIQGFVVE